jgi:hypothetical protein
MNDNFEVSDENKKIIQQEAFPIAWHNFISNNTDISEYLTDMDMMRIYDFENNSINKALRE